MVPMLAYGSWPSSHVQRLHTRRSSGCNADREHGNRIEKTIRSYSGELGIVLRCHTRLQGIGPNLAVDHGAPAMASRLWSARSGDRCMDGDLLVFPWAEGFAQSHQPNTGPLRLLRATALLFLAAQTCQKRGEAERREHTQRGA